MMGKSIEITARDGNRLSAYLAEPEGKARGGVVIVQEIFGVNSHIRSVADRYAAAGYLAVAPAMFDRVQRGYETGYTQEDIQAGVALMKQIDWDQATSDVAAAIDAVKHAGKVGVVGYCWGGAVAWASAARLNGIAAAVPYYGGAIPALINEKPKCPVMLHFGEKDASIPLEKAKEVAAAHPEATVFYYSAGHGFNCDQRGSYDPEASRVAFERTLEFLSKHVG